VSQPVVGGEERFELGRLLDTPVVEQLHEERRYVQSAG
jgi:hypothetical protein